MLVRKSYVINISGSEDREAGDITIRSSIHSDFKLLNAVITNNSGEVVRTIKKKDISEVSLRSREAFFQDGKLLKFDMHWHEYPYQIKYSYEETYSEFLTIANWYPVVYENMPTLHSSLEIQVPTDYKINIYSSSGLNFTEEELPEGIRKLSWDSFFCKLPGKEKFAPSLEEAVPHVLIVPDKFKYNIDGSSRTWADFGNWIDKLNANTLSLPQSEQKIIDSLVVGCETKKDTIQTLYNYLQDYTNYINVSIGYGGLKSYPASYVCQNKYGDCKALTTYMKAMLKYVGIESFYTTINLGLNESRILGSIPSQQFNHVILCVPVNSDTLWLENTSGVLPFDYLSIKNQNRYGLLVDGANSTLIKTPVFSSNDVSEFRKYNYYIGDDGTGSLSMQAKLKGYAFERFSYIRKGWDDKDKKEAVTDYFNVDNFILNDCNIEKYNRNDHSINLSINGQTTKQVKSIGTLKVIRPVPIGIPEFEKPENRKQPLRFNFPINKSDSVIFHLSFLGSCKYQLPDSILINSKYGNFILNSSKIGNEIRIYQQLIIFAGDYPITEYPDFFEFIRQIEQDLKKTAIILAPFETETHE